MKKYISILVAFMVGCYAVADSVEVAMENDIVAKTDQHYTHGTRITYSYPVESSLFPDKDSIRRWSVGQYMYTPRNIRVEEIQVGDRPYAGWLYGAVSASFYNDNSMDFFEATVGATGSWSGGEETQTWFHEQFDATKPMGWDNQVDEQLGVNLTYMRKCKWKYKYADAIITGDATAGNIYCHAGLGFTCRFGYNIPDDFGVVRMEPSSRSPESFGIYSIVGVSERFVGYNYFLEGNDIEETYDIHIERGVYDMSLGFGVRCKSFDAIYLYNIRSKEFKEQDDSSRFGTIALSWSY